MFLNGDLCSVVLTDALLARAQRTGSEGDLMIVCQRLHISED